MNKLLTFTVLVAATFACVSTYDFEDEAFNQFLAEDLRDLHSLDSFQTLNPRNRRDEEAVNGSDKCRSRRKKLCCGEAVIEKAHDKEKEIKRECFKQISANDGEPKADIDPFKCENIQKHRRDMICVMQCVGQKNNVFDDEGNIKEAELTSFVKGVFAEETWFAPIQDNVISICIAEAKNATASRDTSNKDACNPAAGKLFHCMFREIQLGCPDSEIKDQKSCSKLREKIKSKSGDLGHHSPHHYLHDE